MPSPRVVVEADAADVDRGMQRLRAELQIAIEHPRDVVAEIETAIARAAWRNDRRPDRTDVSLVTIDPPGSNDLDQAFAAVRRDGGYRVWYAIADVAAFVAPGRLTDAECHRRGVTLYGPDQRAPLHPVELADGAASLLPDGDRPALLWSIDLDGDALPVTTRFERAVVRSRAQLTYAGVNDALAGGRAPESLLLLREIGARREAAERARGGVSLPVPEQIIEPDDHHYRLAYRAPQTSEGWNAQVSLLAGMEAARIMIEGGSGLLRTLGPPDPYVLKRLRHAAKALGIAWPGSGGYPAFVRSLDPSAAGSALLVQSMRALRGAGYRAFDGAPPSDAVHSAVAAPYAHVTAPLRRLCDRATNEIVLAHVEGREVPDWARAEFDVLPKAMDDARRRESTYSRASLDLVEALVLRPLVGTTFDAVVLDSDPPDHRALVQLRSPAVEAWARGKARVEAGREVRVLLRGADPVARHVDLELR